MVTENLSLSRLFCEADDGGKVGPSGQSMTWHKDMKTLTSGLARIGPFRLLGPRDHPRRWLAQYCSPWLSCVWGLFCSLYLFNLFCSRSVTVSQCFFRWSVGALLQYTEPGNFDVKWMGLKTETETIKGKQTNRKANFRCQDYWRT